MYDSPRFTISVNVMVGIVSQPPTRKCHDQTKTLLSEDLPQRQVFFEPLSSVNLFLNYSIVS